MITAEEFLNKDYFYIVLDIRESPINPTDISRAMIEFAKLHIENIQKLQKSKYYAGESGYIKEEEFIEILNNIK